MDGLIDREAFLSAHKPLQGRVELVQAALAVTETHAVVDGLIGATMKDFEAMPVSRQRAMLAAAIESVVIHPVGKGWRKAGKPKVNTDRVEIPATEHDRGHAPERHRVGDLDCEALGLTILCSHHFVEAPIDRAISVQFQVFQKKEILFGGRQKRPPSFSSLGFTLTGQAAMVESVERTSATRVKADSAVHKNRATRLLLAADVRKAAGSAHCEIESPTPITHWVGADGQAGADHGDPTRVAAARAGEEARFEALTCLLTPCA